MQQGSQENYCETDLPNIYHYGLQIQGDFETRSVFGPYDDTEKYKQKPCLN